VQAVNSHFRSATLLTPALVRAVAPPPPLAAFARASEDELAPGDDCLCNASLSLAVAQQVSTPCPLLEASARALRRFQKLRLKLPEAARTGLSSACARRPARARRRAAPRRAAPLTRRAAAARQPASAAAPRQGLLAEFSPQPGFPAGATSRVAFPARPAGAEAAAAGLPAVATLRIVRSRRGQIDRCLFPRAPHAPPRPFRRGALHSPTILHDPASLAAEHRPPLVKSPTAPPPLSPPYLLDTSRPSSRSYSAENATALLRNLSLPGGFLDGLHLLLPEAGPYASFPILAFARADARAQVFLGAPGPADGAPFELGPPLVSFSAGRPVPRALLPTLSAAEPLYFRAAPYSRAGVAPWVTYTLAVSAAEPRALPTRGGAQLVISGSGLAGARVAVVSYRPCPRPAGPPPMLVSPASAPVLGC